MPSHALAPLTKESCRCGPPRKRQATAARDSCAPGCDQVLTGRLSELESLVGRLQEDTTRVQLRSGAPAHCTLHAMPLEQPILPGSQLRLRTPGSQALASPSASMCETCTRRSSENTVSGLVRSSNSRASEQAESSGERGPGISLYECETVCWGCGGLLSSQYA